MIFRKILLASLTCALAFSASGASAADFNEERAAIWVTRTNGFVDAATGSDMTLDNLSPRLSGACQGITMEVSKPNVPAWAQTSHLYFCHAVDDIKHKYAKPLCKDLKTSLKALQKMDRTREPENVVAAADTLILLEEAMLEGFAKGKICR